MSETFGAEFAVCFAVDDSDAWTFKDESRARHELCEKLKIVHGLPVDRDSNGHLLVAFSATREHLREIRDRMDQSCGYGDFDARYLCVWPDPDGEMLTGEALAAWLDEEV